MTLAKIRKLRQNGQKPSHAILFLDKDYSRQSDSFLLVVIGLKESIERLDVRPLVGVRVGVTNLLPEPDRALALLDRLAEVDVELFAFDGAGLEEAQSHPLAIGMEKLKLNKWSDDLLWRY